MAGSGKSRRDVQRSKVYRWERAAIKRLTGRGIYDPEFRTLDECEEFMNPVWRAERSRVEGALKNPPTLARYLRGQRSATASFWLSEIKLPLWSRSRWVILHEMVHCMIKGDYGHGPRFVGLLIGIVSRHLDYDADLLMQMADEMGVKYDVRSIGMVPVRGPVFHLERLLKTEKPMTAMDLSCHLNIIDGIEITPMQVRGAALRLIRDGKARWLRNKLVPLESACMPEPMLMAA